MGLDHVVGQQLIKRFQVGIQHGRVACQISFIQFEWQTDLSAVF